MTSRDIPRLMGLVVALRFYSWGVGCLALTAFLGSVGANYVGRAAVSGLAVGVLFGVYLFLTGFVLTAWRLEGWARKAASLSPVLAVVVSVTPAARESLLALAWIWCVPVVLTWGAYRSQAAVFSQSKSVAFGKVAQGLLASGLLAFSIAPHPAFALGLGSLLAVLLWTYWQVWLKELRHTILTYETLDR